MNRRSFLLGCAGGPLLAGTSPVGFRFTDITASSGIHFDHHSGAFGNKYLPETLGPGCAFLDYDNDGYQDILFVDGMDCPDTNGVNRKVLCVSIATTETEHSQMSRSRLGSIRRCTVSALL